MIRKIKTLIKEIESHYDKIDSEIKKNITLDKEINLIRENIGDLQNTILLRNDNKIQSIILKMNSHAGDVIINETFVDPKFEFNKGFEVIPGKSCLRLKATGIVEEIPKDIIVGYNNEDRLGVVAFEFANVVTLNYVDVFFRNSNGVKIKPVDVLYEYQNEEGSLLENFERFFSRGVNDETDKYYFYAKKINKIKFVFDSSIEWVKYKEAIAKFYLEEFEQENEIVMKYINESQSNKISLVRNSDDRFSTLGFEISGDGNQYSKIDFVNNKTIITTESKELFVKIKQKTEIKNSIKEEQVVKSTTSSEVFLELDDSSELAPINRFIENVKVRVSVGTAKSIAEFNKDFCLKEDGSNYIDLNFIKEVETMEKRTINILKDMDSIEAISEINTPVIYFEKTTNKVYYPSFFTRDKEYTISVTFEFSEVEFQDVLSEKNYTPFIFSLMAEV